MLPLLFRPFVACWLDLSAQDHHVEGDIRYIARGVVGVLPNRDAVEACWGRRRVAVAAFVAVGCVAAAVSAASLAAGGGQGRRDAATLAVESAGVGSPSGVYGLDPANLPPGYEPVGFGPVPPESADPDAARSVTADSYRVTSGASVAVLTGSSDGLESFLPAAPGEEIELAGRVVVVYDEVSEPGRVVVGVASATEGSWDAVVIADASVGELEDFVSAVAAPADQRPGDLVASGHLDVVSGAAPAAVASYQGEEAQEEIMIATFPGQGLTPVLREIVGNAEDVTIHGLPGLAFSAEEPRELVAWETPDDQLVMVVVPASLGRSTAMSLAEVVELVDPAPADSDLLE